MVAAYGFDEGGGTTTADSSGFGNVGTLSGATWTPSGKFGQALSFAGAQLVTVNDAASLDFTTGMTIEAWVYPTANGSLWRTAVLKEASAGLAYALYATTPTSNRPQGYVATTSERGVVGSAALPLNAWSHLATTFDGAALRIFVNGTQTGTLALTGNILVSAGALRIGGNTIWGEYFQGRLDELRLYNRALSAAEIQADMNTPITPLGPDTTPPTAPATLTATPASATQINLSWTAATDNVGVTGYRVERCQGSGCSNFAEIATPTGTTFNDTGLTASTSYSYRVRANDGAGNLGSYSPSASATTQAPPDTTPPTAPATLTATPASATQINLAWAAATDNVGVTGYRVERCQGGGCSNFAQIATPTGTTFNNTGLTGSTSYSYRVRATDAAGNLGSYSPVASATTPAAPDTTPPTAPSNLTATPASTTQINLAWTAATDNVGVTGYRVERCQGSGCSNFAEVATPTGTTLNDTGLTASTSYSYRVRAVDAAVNLGPYSNTASATTQSVPDTTSPTAPSNLTATAASATQINLAWTAATDNIGVTGYRVERCQGGGCSNFAQVATPTGTTLNDTGLTASTSYSYRVRAVDAAVNLGPYSNTASATTLAGGGSPGLVAAYGFDEGTGTTASDSSGQGNVGTLSGATWTTSGKFGQALSFAGSHLVTVNDAAILDLTAGMTIEAWVYPTAAGGAWRSAVLKETTGGLVYALYTASPGDLPQGYVRTSSERGVAGTSALPLNAWNHLATTYDGATLRVFVNGTQTGTLALTGNISVSTGALRIGGNTIWGEYFQGRLDEVRLYNRALSVAEIQTDMTTPITAVVQDTTPPTAPATLTATAASATQINLSWAAATDNVGVTGYRVEQCQGGGCSNFAEIASPTGTTFNNTGLTGSTSYSYRVRAVDAAGNLGPFSPTASATTLIPDTTPPTAPSNLSATAASYSQINLTWTASTDDVGVTGYRVERCQGVGCSNFGQVATPTGTTLNDGGLNPSTTYTYRVRAADAAGNLGGYSNLAAATTAATNPVVLENQNPGSSAWQLGDAYGRAIGTDSVGQIKGYASATSINKGENINFHVSVNPAQTFTIDVYRIGWYQGLGGRLMQHIGPLDGIRQPTCPTNATTGMIECAWTPSYTLTTLNTWTSGIYLAVLKNAQNFHNYIVFALRDDSRVGALLYQQPVTTYQAYNDYPDDNVTGKSLYEHNSYGANTIAGTKRAVKVSFDRPYAASGADGFIFLSEINFVRWAEKSGYDITYSTSVDTHSSGNILLNHRGFLSLPHDEYWSKAMYDAATAARGAGVNLAFFGANSIYWQIRFEPSTTGVPNRVVVCYKDLNLDPLTDPTQKTIKWRDDPVSRPEQTLVGVQFTDGPNNGSAPLVVTNSTSWVYAGSGFSNGNSVPGLVWYESDRLMSEYPGPTAVAGTYTLLSHSPYAGSTGQDYQNASIYQAPSGAWVFAAGTMGWSWGLDDFYPEGSMNTVDSRIQRATANVLNRFFNP